MSHESKSDDEAPSDSAGGSRAKDKIFVKVAKLSVKKSRTRGEVTIRIAREKVETLRIGQRVRLRTAVNEGEIAAIKVGVYSGRLVVEYAVQWLDHPGRFEYPSESLVAVGGRPPTAMIQPVEQSDPKGRPTPDAEPSTSLSAAVWQLRQQLIDEFARVKSGHLTVAEAKRKYSELVQCPTRASSVCRLCHQPIMAGAVFSPRGYAHADCCRERDRFVLTALTHDTYVAAKELRRGTSP